RRRAARARPPRRQQRLGRQLRVAARRRPARRPPARDRRAARVERPAGAHLPVRARRRAVPPPRRAARHGDRRAGVLAARARRGRHRGGAAVARRPAGAVRLDQRHRDRPAAGRAAPGGRQRRRRPRAGRALRRPQPPQRRLKAAACRTPPSRRTLTAADARAGERLSRVVGPLLAQDWGADGVQTRGDSAEEVGIEEGPGLLESVWRYRLLVVLLLLLGCAAGYGLATVQEVRYEGVTMVLLADPRGSEVFGEDSAPADSNRYVRNQAQLVTSSRVLRDAAARAGLDLSLDELRERVPAEAADDVDVITIRALAG